MSKPDHSEVSDHASIYATLLIYICIIYTYTYVLIDIFLNYQQLLKDYVWFLYMLCGWQLHKRSYFTVVNSANSRISNFWVLTSKLQPQLQSSWVKSFNIFISCHINNYLSYLSSFTVSIAYKFSNVQNIL